MKTRWKIVQNSNFFIILKINELDEIFTLKAIISRLIIESRLFMSLIHVWLFQGESLLNHLKNNNLRKHSFRITNKQDKDDIFKTL